MPASTGIASSTSLLSTSPPASPAPKRPRRKVEQALQATIVHYHQVCVSNPGAAMLFAIPNGEARDPVTAAKLVGISGEMRALLFEDEQLRPYGQGVLPGAPDLVLLTPGPCTDLIEVKVPTEPGQRGGKLSPMQKRFRAAAEAMGHHWHTIDNLEAYAALLAERGVRTRATRLASGAFIGELPPPTLAPILPPRRG